MYIIMFVLNDSKKLDMILDGWRNVGVQGVTILESIGAVAREGGPSHEEGRGPRL